MNRLFAAEMLKLRHRWMPRVIILIMLAITALVFWGIGTSSSQRVNLVLPRGWLIALFLAANLAPFLWPVLGGSWSGSEYGWGTIRMVLSRRPNRIAFSLAQMLALALILLAALILAFILGTIGGLIAGAGTSFGTFDTTGLPGGFGAIVVKIFLGSWFVLGFYALLGYAAGSIFRSAAFGIGAGIGITVAQLVLTGILYAIGGTWKLVAQHFPYAYTNALTQRLVAEGTTRQFATTSSSQPGITECVIGIAIYAAILVAATLIFLRQRDVTA
jgi:ABC-type transport system involved in multi-copper enzyme maturation permease subunit